MSKDKSDKQALTQLTREHYETHPFEFLSDTEDEQPKAFLDFVFKRINENDFVADVGCGPGRSTKVLGDHGVNFVGLDLSHTSLCSAQRRAPGRYLQADILSLPVKSDSFDVVITDGVLHHTADPLAAFKESCRILKTGGLIYVAVYRKGGYYDFLYNVPGKVIRWLEKFAVGRALIFITLIPIYFVLHSIRSGGRRSWRGVVNLFYDYFITPQAKFYSEQEIGDWFVEEGFKVESYVPKIGNVHAFIAKKE